MSLGARLPTRLDRYPAKMVSRLAELLVDKYAITARRVLDPFCGSGAILAAAHRRGIPVSGVDVNPLSKLYCHVKVNGFIPNEAITLAVEMVKVARNVKMPAIIQWPGKDYWFTPGTVRKFECLRRAMLELRLDESDAGMAVLLALALSVRLCSRADQRSPKPFVSRQARYTRSGRHFDPFRVVIDVLGDLALLYKTESRGVDSRLVVADVRRDTSLFRRIGRHSHVITSPPYINAQDYFRNFKLELHVLEGVLPYRVADLREIFIGTERGDLLEEVPRDVMRRNYHLLPAFTQLERSDTRLSAVVHRYLYDMSCAFDTIKCCLEPGAIFILICGDNLIGGIRICTWDILRRVLEEKGFRLVDMFADKIADRLLPPKRSGHKGMIKEEVVCAFRLQ